MSPDAEDRSGQNVVRLPPEADFAAQPKRDVLTIAAPEMKWSNDETDRQ